MICLKKIVLLCSVLILFILPTKVSAEENGFKLTCDGNVNNYTTIYEAVKNAVSKTSCIIEAYEDIHMDKSITIDANYDITIDGKNHNIMYANTSSNTWYTGQLFNVKSNGQLKLLDLVIDGNNNYSFDIESYNNDLHNSVKVTDVMKYVVPEPNKPSITSTLISNSGTLIVKDSTIKNIYTAKSASIISASSNSTTTYDNSIIKNCFSNGSGLAVNANGASSRIFIEGDTLIDNNYIASNGGIFK